MYASIRRSCDFRLYSHLFILTLKQVKYREFSRYYSVHNEQYEQQTDYHEVIALSSSRKHFQNKISALCNVLDFNCFQKNPAYTCIGTKQCKYAFMIASCFC